MAEHNEKEWPAFCDTLTNLQSNWTCEETVTFQHTAHMSLLLL